MRALLFFFFIVFVACAVTPKSVEQRSEAAVTTQDAIQTEGVIGYYKTFKGGVLYGDFDGDRSVDTVREELISMETRMRIDSFPDPYSIGWDSLVTYGDRNGFMPILTSSCPGPDTLSSTIALGYYVVLNVGDINHDQRDEIALVPDLLDFSNLNTCRVYTLCDGQWKQVGGFAVNEDAFDYPEGKKDYEFHDIPGFLERRKGVWKFKDYDKSIHARTEAKAEKMRTLKTKRCKKCLQPEGCL